jgi:hypothetical protein
MYILHHAPYIAVTIVCYTLVLVTFLLERLWRWWWRRHQQRTKRRNSAEQPP